MRPYILFILPALIVLSSDLQAQQDYIFPFHQDSLFGYTNSHCDTIVQAIFEEAFETIGTISPVRYRNKWGFIENSGAFYIKPKYDSLVDFGYGNWELRKGHIHKRVSKFKYLWGHEERGYRSYGADFGLISSDSTPIVKRKDGYFGLLFDHIPPEEKKTIQDTLGPFDSVFIIKNQVFGLMRNRMIAIFANYPRIIKLEAMLAQIDFRFDELKFFPYSTRYPDPRGNHELVGYKSNGLWGYMRIYFPYDIITPPIYYSISSLASNYIGLVEFKPGRFGYIDTKGKEYFERDP